MNILIHGISTRMGGAKRHLDNMMKHLAICGENHKYYVIINDEYDAAWENGEIETVRFPLKYCNGLRRIYFDNVIVNRLIREYSIDVLVSFGNFGPFRARCKHILFEMNALYFCKNIRPIVGTKEKINYAIKRWLIKISGSRADLIVTPSQSLKNQLIKSLNFPANKIEVLYHAMENIANNNIESIPYDMTNKVFFFYPSHLARHKGVHILLDALIMLKKKKTNLPDFQILCTFAKEDEPRYFDELMDTIEKNDLANMIRFIGHVPQDKIYAYYKVADYMIYTSLCESFGFALIEAKNLHLPVLCSGIAINQEISKNSALYYRWNDSKDLANKLYCFVRERPSNFDFEDDLLHWMWDKYTDRLLNLIAETYHGGS